MPAAEQILAQLTALASDAIGLAVAWHVAIALALVTIALGWRPPTRVALLLLAAPLASVSLLALAVGNPFNAVVFATACAGIVVCAMRSTPATAAAGARWATVVGLAMIAYAWGYPHFLADRAPVVYLVAAPVGLVPCPTLALAIGGALLGGGLDRRAAIVLALLGALYAMVGVLYLGVLLDLGLALGATALAVVVTLPQRFQAAAHSS